MTKSHTPPSTDRIAVADLCQGDDLRCTCGSLVARWTDAGIELKCRRCKRVLVLPLPASLAPRPPP